MKILHGISFVLVIVGSLNWLLYTFGWGIGSFIPSAVADVLYVLIGLSAVYLVIEHKKVCKHCESKSQPISPGM
jgi:uncharacterized membrane protein YuzA (DUF378 family)